MVKYAYNSFIGKLFVTALSSQRGRSDSETKAKPKNNIHCASAWFSLVKSFENTHYHIVKSPKPHGETKCVG